jgi:hypothetical protein
LSTLAAAPRGPLIPNREQGSGPQSDSPTRRPWARDGLRPSGGTCRKGTDELLRPFLGRVSGSHCKKREQPAGSHLEPALLKEVKLSSSPGRAARQRCAVGFFYWSVVSGFGVAQATDNWQLTIRPGSCMGWLVRLHYRLKGPAWPGGDFGTFIASGTPI